MKVYQSKMEQISNCDEVVEKTRLDEMWSYVKCRKGEKRNSIWIWTAVCDEKFLFEVGSREEETFWKLSEQLPESELYYTDDYEVYRWLPCNQHVNGKEGKRETNWNEGKHSVLRDKLARLKRQTKAYTKSVWMLVASIALVAVKNGWT